MIDISVLWSIIFIIEGLKTKVQKTSSKMVDNILVVGFNLNWLSRKDKGIKASFLLRKIKNPLIP